MACALIALIAKLYCACTTIGTTDTFLFHMFGKTIAADGLMAMYRATALFNHTPIVGEFAAAAWRLEQATGIGFPLYIRVPGILADFLSVFLLVWLRERTGRPAWWAIGLFALSPVSFMIAGYHGNVDAVLAGLLLFATCCCVAPRPLACGILLGLACNVKIVALLLSPVLFFYWAHRSRALPFTLGAIVTTLIGWAAPLAVLPQTFLRNVLGYGGYWGDWGITYLLGRSGWSEFQQNGFLELSSAAPRLLWAMTSSGFRLSVVWYCSIASSTRPALANSIPRWYRALAKSGCNFIACSNWAIASGVRPAIWCAFPRRK